MGGADLATTIRRVAETLDLGEYEIETYLAVLEHGELTAAEIAEETDVPQPRVYDTVRSLAGRGLVELRESRPLRVVAIDPGDAFDDVQSTMDDLLSGLETRFTAPATDTEAVTLVKSRSTILRYLEDVIESAEYELALSVTPGLLRRFEDALASAADRGVRIELVVAPVDEAPDPADFDYSRIATTAMGRRGVTTPVIVVADGEYSVYATRDAVRDGTEKYGVIFNRSALGFVLVAFFGTVIWTTADHTLVDTPPERDFPRRYASLRRCVKELRSIDEEVYATVDGRDVVTGAERSVDGRVLDAHYTPDLEVATLAIESDGERIEVGGRVAAYEDVEAHTIELRLEES